MPLTPAGARVQARMTSPLGFWFWMLVKLPAALFCGVRL